MNNERFVRHEPCPKCHSRDNVGVYADGHKWCFGCGYYVPSPDSIENLKRRSQKMENNNNVASIDSSTFTHILPAVALAWLKKYGLSDQEITHYDLMWNTKTDSLVFAIRDALGITLTNERYFGSNPMHPKYITNGHKETNTVYLANKQTPNSLVLVEDFVSAIKVARFANCLPLFGCTIPYNVIRWATDRFKCLRIWLDMNKASESIAQASRLSQLVPNTRSILTELDPKEYSNNQLILILKEHKVLA